MRTDAIIHTTIITACEKGARWERGVRTMQGMKTRQMQLDVTACGATISTTAKGGRWLNALLLLFGVCKEAVRPNQVTVNAAVSACEQAQWRHAFLTLSAAGLEGLQLDIISCNTALGSCVAVAPWQLAVALFAGMFGNWQRDIVTYNTLMSAYEKRGLWREGLQLLSEQLRGAVRLDIISMSANMGAHARVGQWEHALISFQAMTCYGVRLNIVPFSMAVDACDAQRCWQAAAGLMLEASVTLRLDAISLNSALKAGASWRQSQTILANSQSLLLEVDLVMTTTAIGAAASDSTWRYALFLHEEFHRSDGHDDLTNFNAIVSACERVCLWAHVLHMFADISRFTLHPDVLTSGSILHACAYGRRGLQVQVMLEQLSLAGFQACSHQKGQLAKMVSTTKYY